MLIPSIDLMGGRIVQLVQGEKLKLAFDDFEYWIERFSSYPMVQLIDLDAAMRQGDNAALIEKIASRLPCQVGGGIATIERARQVLASGARRVIFGSALFRSADGAGVVDIPLAGGIQEEIGAERFVASIDTKRGQVAVKGWREQAGLTPQDAIAALNPFCGAFLYTHVDTEGTMQGFPLEVARSLRSLTDRQLIVAGGIREQREIDALHQMNVDAVAGMAIYTGALAT
ncbi:MAG TPA: HisA/HisF-related TIM barrel protein [Alloacidobacterium sp.]|nr:HisA/HisF-related TIM barrel protein [Alloacidobacterium sp.]